MYFRVVGHDGYGMWRQDKDTMMNLLSDHQYELFIRLQDDMPRTHSPLFLSWDKIRHWFTSWGWQQFEPVIQPLIDEGHLVLLEADSPPGTERYRDRWQVAMRIEEHVQ